MINRNNYILDDVPVLSPASPEYGVFWKEQKKLCDHGVWSGGLWRPGTLYHYVNFWHIEVKKNPEDKFGQIALPMYRDIEDEIHIAYMEARGFSRFSDQTKEDVKGKAPRDVMNAWYPRDMGTPLFENEAKNMIIVTNRGAGKSYTIAGIIGYEYTFITSDKGRKDSVVGAWDTKYSDDLLSKVKLGLEKYEGGVEFNGKYYPPPFSKRYRGSWNSGKFIENRYEIFRGKNRISKGDGSKIHHRVYRNNPQAGVGTRPVLAIYEEAGEFLNLEQSWNATLQALRNGTYQFGTNLALGTGGNMKGGTQDLSRMMREPEAYNCVSFEDTITHKGRHSLFIDATRGLNEFKDENGDSKREEARDKLITYREKLLNDNASKDMIEQELMYRPLSLDEAFLISSGNIFPRALLQEHLGNVENNSALLHKGQIGRLEFNDKAKIVWFVDPKLKQITDYPLRNNADTTGAITIYEHPYLDEHGNVPHYLYLGGLDPIDQDSAEFSTSLLAFVIYKRFHKLDMYFDLPVAEYVGRPEFVEQAYETVRRMLLYYNAQCLYENNLKGFFIYMRNKRCEHLLADTPGAIRDVIEDSKVNRVKGVHMVEKIKDYCERLTNSWLRTEYEPGHRNLEKIYSTALLKELIMYNRQGNFDRAISFFMVMLYDQELHEIVVKENKSANRANEFFPQLSKLNLIKKPNLLG